MLNPSTNLLALPVGADWAKLANIQEFEISRTSEITCSGSSSILVDRDANTNDIDAALREIRSLEHMDGTTVHTAVTLRNLCIPGYFHDGSGFDVHFTHFRKLDLSGNLVSGNLNLGEVNDWNHLEELSLARNKLGGELPAILDELPRLKILDLSGNSFTGPILNDWAVGCSLQELDLTDNHLNGTWPQNLLFCGGLNALKLSNNALNGEIPAQFFANLGLRFLHLSNQVEKGGGLSGPLPPSLFQMRRPLGTLEELKIDRNQFTGTIPEIQVSKAGDCEIYYCPAAVPAGLVPSNSSTGCETEAACASGGHCTVAFGYQQFRQCTLEYVTPINGEVEQYVTGEGVYDNPLQNLNILLLHDNELDGQLPDLTPYCVSRSAGTLTEFTFHENPISGKLPQSYAFCTGLSTLQLEGLPNLEGPLPRIEPALRACAACASRTNIITRELDETAGCPAGTIEQTTVDTNGVDSNGIALRAHGAACCRWYKCFSGSYRYSAFANAMSPYFTSYPLPTPGDAPVPNEDCTATICAQDLLLGAPAVEDGMTDGEIRAGTMGACAVLMDEYEYFNPPYLTGDAFCNQDHIGADYSSLENTGSNLDTVKIDGSRMTAMSGSFPQLDNSAQLHTIDIVNAPWLDAIPVLQTEAGPIAGPNPCERGQMPQDPDCTWVPIYPALETISIVDSIAPTSDDGLTYAVHPQLHIGDFHGHRELQTVILRGNNFKGDLPNVDDPEGDHIDDLQTFDVSSNSFGLGDCIDVSSGVGGDVDCVPNSFQYLYKLQDFRLNDNSMSGDVPNVFFTLPHLRSLRLSYNSYSGFAVACSSAAECTCDDAAGTSTILSMYHRRDVDFAVSTDINGQETITSTETFIPTFDDTDGLSSQDHLISIRYNNLTALPVHQLRMFATIDAGNNQITPDGLKGTYSGTTVDVFSELSDAGCAAYTYPSLQNVDLSENPFGNCAATSNSGACVNDLETMMEEFRGIAKMRKLDLNDGSFSEKLQFPADWAFATMWPDIVSLRLGGIFRGVMPFGSLGLPSGPEGLTTLHLMDGELLSPVQLGPVDAERIESLLAAKFAPYEISYENRQISVVPAADADGFAYTKVSFTVLKGASWASADGPSPGVTAVTAARLANDLGITHLQQMDSQAQVCDSDQNCGICRNAGRGFVEYCAYLGRPDSSQPLDWEIEAADQSGKLLADTLVAWPLLDTAGITAAKLKQQVEALRDATDIQYEKMSVLYDYTVRHLGCPGRGCAADCVYTADETCGWAGDYEVTFKLVEAQARTPPFFTLKNIQQLEIQNNDLGGELRNVYNHLDYSTISLNGGMPAKYFNVTPMAHADNLFFHGNRFSGAIPAILPAHVLATVDPCGVESHLTGAVMSPPACTPPENFIYQLIFSRASPSAVGFCSKNALTGLYECGNNAFDCPIPSIPQAFYVRNTKNDPEDGYCGCAECEDYDSSGNLLRACRPDCECPACDCVSGQHTLERDPDTGQVTLGPVCEINPYTDCSDRVSKFSYTHPIYDSADCSCPSGSDCASSMDMSTSNDHATDACRPFCSQCEPGRYASGTNSLTCDLCDPGHFSSQYGQTDCDACNRGKYSEGGGAAGGGACKLCPVGLYGVTEGAAACEPAPRGTYVDFEGAYCLDPPDKIPGVWGGTTCDMINATEQPVGPRHCNGGKHASGYNSTQCEDCEEGRFSLPGGMYRECTPCPAGTMNDPATSDSALLCTSCEPGYYQDSEGSNECKQAPIGYFSPSSGLEAAVKCEGRTVAPYAGLTECEECPEKLRPDDDHINCIPCSVFGGEDGCEMDQMTVIGLLGAVAVLVVIIGLSLYKCRSDSKHKQAREHIKKQRANRA